VLLHTAFASKAFGYDRGGIMVAIASEIADFHVGVGDRLLDKALNFPGIHRHLASPGQTHLLSGSLN
jgi:hypothetical protein